MKNTGDLLQRGWETSLRPSMRTLTPCILRKGISTAQSVGAPTITLAGRRGMGDMDEKIALL